MNEAENTKNKFPQNEMAIPRVVVAFGECRLYESTRLFELYTKMGKSHNLFRKIDGGDS